VFFFLNPVADWIVVPRCLSGIDLKNLCTGDYFVNRTKLIQLLPSLALSSILFLPSPAVSENSNVVPPLSLLLLGGIHYNEVTSATGRIWLDRNLGASRVATSSTDSEAYGDLYQWGRLTDGHQNRLSSTTEDLSSGDVPGHGNFIKTSILPGDWRDPQNDDLWKEMSGVNINNPCPSGFRLPTRTELDDERISWVDDNGSTDDADGAFDSSLKLVMAGSRPIDGTLYSLDITGYYWSNTVSGTNASQLIFDSDFAGMSSYNRAGGRSVRCIKD
jgi:uncharacterized protein (TIGR02145 family)